MRKSIATLGLIFAAAGSPAAAEGLTVDTTIGFESRYLFRGVQFAQSSFQPAVTVGHEGFYIGAWANLPVGDEDLSLIGGQEIDLIAGWGTDLSEIVAIDIGVTYYTFPELDDGLFDIYEEDGDGLGSNTVEPYVGFSFAIPLSPSIYFYRDFMFDTFTVQGSGEYSIPLAEKLSFDLGGILGYVVDDDAGGDYLYGHGTANFTYALSESSSFYIGGRFGGSNIDGGSVVDDASMGTTQSSGLWLGLGFSSSF